MPSPWVDPADRHLDKVLIPGAPLVLPRARLKGYNLAPAAAPVQFEALARAHLAGAADRLGLERDLGFVLLHRCGAAFSFLLRSTWRGSNGLWESVLYKGSEAMTDFEPFARPGAHAPTFCVWELAAVEHERRAWIRFLRSPREGADEVRDLDDLAPATTV